MRDKSSSLVLVRLTLSKVCVTFAQARVDPDRRFIAAASSILKFPLASVI